ncbi:MAG TPA: hypothetical protein VKR58_03230, partial [Aquella sp.]|nr:hypothetical protein [Aquella sp.]
QVDIIKINGTTSSLLFSIEVSVNSARDPSPPITKLGNQFLAVGQFKSIQIWNWKTCKYVNEIQTHGKIKKLVGLKNNMLISYDNFHDNSLTIWRPRLNTDLNTDAYQIATYINLPKNDNQKIESIKELLVHSEKIIVLVEFRYDDKTATKKQSIIIANRHNWEVYQNIPTEDIKTLSLLPDGSLAGVFNYHAFKSIMIWKLENDRYAGPSPYQAREGFLIEKKDQLNIDDKIIIAPLKNPGLIALFSPRRNQFTPVPDHIYIIDTRMGLIKEWEDISQTAADLTMPDGSIVSSSNFKLNPDDYSLRILSFKENKPALQQRNALRL